MARGWLECRLGSVYSMTWRLRNAFIFGIEPLGAAAGIGRRGKLLSRLTVDLHYEEEIIGAIRIEPDLTTGTLPRPETIRLGRPITQSFATRALVLRLPEAADAIALASLAQALRHVLPVHLGVEEDALEVVALTGDDIDGVATWGGGDRRSLPGRHRPDRCDPRRQQPDPAAVRPDAPVAAGLPVPERSGLRRVPALARGPGGQLRSAADARAGPRRARSDRLSCGAKARSSHSAGGRIHAPAAGKGLRGLAGGAQSTTRRSLIPAKRLPPRRR